ncbi:MAG: DUF5071 domain-containing protein [Ruminococcus flavefaciens]|nr:DUF5071 domain-containing protein [Ruminococcus flavefaciens]
MSIRDFLPKDKFDKSGLSSLYALTDEEIKSVILDLLEWVQDMNFPVADEVCRIVAGHYAVADDYIINILDVSQHDELWKYFIITGLLPLIEKPSERLKNAVSRIAYSPSDSEKAEEVDMTALEYLESIGEVLNK